MLHRRPIRLTAALAALAMLLSAFVLGGCSSATRFGYNHLDWLAKRELNKYVDMTDAQEAQFERQFDVLWAWHRETQLPQYAADLRRLATQVQGPIDLEMLAAVLDTLEVHQARLIDRALPAAAALLATLSDDQVSELFDKVDEDMQEANEDVAGDSAEERRKDRIKDQRRWFKKRYDRISDAQEARVEQWAASRRDLSAYWPSVNQAGRDAFAGVLARREAPDFADQLEALLDNAEQAWPPAVRDDVEYNRQRWRELVVDMHAMASAKQRRAFAEFLLEYAEDFEVLSAR